MFRLVHFSDIHVTASDVSWRKRDWLNKHMSAWVNHTLLGRGFRFRDTESVLQALRNDLRTGGFDRVIFSGDATALGFHEEHVRAAELIGVADGLPGLAVPGNHDYMTRNSEHGGFFERTFAPWQKGERIDESVYPFAQRVGSGWLVAVNSACHNRWAWDARGRVGLAQLRRLERLLERLDGSPRILVTHYPVTLATGKPELKMRCLRDLGDLLRVASAHGIGLWLHGHRHGTYLRMPCDLHPFPVLCAGSATQHGLWSYRVLTLTGHHLHIETRVFDPTPGVFRTDEMTELELRVAQPSLAAVAAQ